MNLRKDLIMGNPEKEKPCNSEKPSSKNQNKIHVYPAMQAFYGMPPYLNSSSPRALPYMWAPQIQSIIPPYYANGGVYAHVGLPLTIKSDGGATVKQSSDSEETDTEGYSDGAGSYKKRSRRGYPNKGDCSVKTDPTSNNTVDVVPPANSKEKTVDNTSSSSVLELKDLKFSPSPTPTTNANSGLQTPLPNEDWLLNECELKRERRKQSNRESARRSRLRKQAEAEELATKVKALTAENVTLTSEINKLMESSEKLKLQNGTLMEKLRDSQVVQGEEVNIHEPKPDGTTNLLERVNNSGKINEDEDSAYENTSSGAKLHQLLDPSPRTDTAVAV